ncbi:hypothetical protein ACFWB6_08235 [Streptomyces mirabilis]|uniref:hypothetical protein n=1 Tax=Streptomyces mirabilis TaxID=68239 RepID=UPI0036B4914F
MGGEGLAGFEDEAGQGWRPPKGRTWGRRGHTPVVRITSAGTKRVSMAALICTKSGRRSRLIYRIHLDRGPAKGRRKGFTATDYARLLDAAPGLRPTLQAAGRGNTAHYPLSATATALTDLGTVSVIGPVETSAN